MQERGLFARLDVELDVVVDQVADQAAVEVGRGGAQFLVVIGAWRGSRCQPPTFLQRDALDALAAHLFEEVGVADLARTCVAVRSNCLNTVNSTRAITSQTATLENH